MTRLAALALILSAACTPEPASLALGAEPEIALPRVAAPHTVRLADLLVPEPGAVTPELIERCERGQDLTDDLVVNVLIVSPEHGVELGGQRMLDIAADGQIATDESGGYDPDPVYLQLKGRLQAAHELAEACPAWTGGEPYTPRLALAVDGRIQAFTEFRLYGAAFSLGYDQVFELTALSSPGATDWIAQPTSETADLTSESDSPYAPIHLSFRDHRVVLAGGILSDLRPQGIELPCQGRCDRAEAVPTSEITELVQSSYEIHSDSRTVSVIVDEYVSQEARLAAEHALREAGASDIRFSRIGAPLQLCPGELLPLPELPTAPLDLSPSAEHPARVSHRIR